MWSRVREKLASKTSSRRSSKYGSKRAKPAKLEPPAVKEIMSTPEPLFAVTGKIGQKMKPSKISTGNYFVIGLKC